MGIFHTLSEIAKNNDKFKKYEQEQRDNDVQREELNRRREHKQQEIKAAQDLGKTIIDVVDIMDQHSEDIAENVETVTEPIVGLSPFIAGLIGLGASYKTLIGPAANNEEKIFQAFRKNPEVKNLVEKINEADKKINYKEPWEISSWDLMEERAIEKIKKRHPDLGLEAEKLYKNYKKGVNKQYKKIKIGIAIPIISSIVGFIASNIYTTKLQVESSRVARWQARKVLEDPKYFVNYTPEQIEEAQKALENNPENKKKDKKFKTDNLKGGMFKGLVSVIKDNRAYRKWKKSDVDESKKVDRQLTPEEIKQAQKDKEVIQRVVRSINNQAELYSQNMEVAANVIMGTTPFLGAAVGAVVSAVMNWTKVIPNFIKKQTEKYGSEEAKKAYKEMQATKEGTREFKASEEIVMEKKIKKVSAVAMTTKWGRRGVFGLIGGFVTGIVGSLIALKLQKASSRTGRYIAKRELEENPKNFIGYTEEEMQEVKDIKAPKKTFGEKVKDYALFIPNVLKNYFEYQKYKKTELKQNKMLQEELTKLEVTPNQLKEAKNLQRKIFNTFEKVDDKSQEYSESVEAAVEIAKPVIVSMGFATLISPFAIFALQAARGKITPSGAIEKLTKFLSNHTDFLKGKKVNNYLTKVKDNFNYVISDTKMSDYDKERVFKDVLSKFVDKDTLKQFDSLYGDEREQLFKVLDIQLREFTDELVQELDTKMIKEYLNEAKERARNMSEEDFQKIIQSNKKMKALFSKSDKKQFGAILENLEKTLDNLPQEKLDELINTVKEAISKNPYEVLNLFNNAGKLKDIFVTKGITASIAAAGASWTALNLLVTFTIESYLAKLQKEAGRLGVIKALDELDDPMYYADSEAPTTSSNTPEENAVQENQLAKNKYLL